MAESGNHSSDETIPRKKVKVEEDDSGSSSTEQKEPNRSTPNLLIKVNFSGKTKDCQTDGKETIKDMLIRCYPKVPKERNLENMILKRASIDCAINLGLPTGALNEKEKDYECFVFPKKGEKPDFANTRRYNVQNFKKVWKMGCFFIKFDKKRRGRNQPLVGDIRDEVEMIQIDFFPGESLYEAIVRDKRLKIRNGDNLVVRKWYFKSDDSEIPLGNDASLYKKKVLKLFQRQQPADNLQDHVPDRPEPELAGTTVVMKENDAVIPKSGNSGPSSPVTQFTCDEDLQDFLEKHFDIGVQKQADQKKEKNRIFKIKKLLSSYNKFALERGNVRLVSKMKDLTKMSDSVGAVVVELDSNVEVFKGTCFVIGSEYVITNGHVIDSTSKMIGFKDFYVDFKYENGCHGYKFRFFQLPVVIDFALDYAILQLREPANSKLPEWPPSLTKCGYVIPNIDCYINAGDWLTLVGYPQQADGKVIEDACPLKPLENLDENFVVALSQQSPHDFNVLRDKRRQTYDTGGFFNGSSGSPGVLMNEKLLIILHCRGFPLQDGGGSIVEQGVRMSAIRNDVESRINFGSLPEYTLNELFDIPLE